MKGHSARSIIKDESLASVIIIEDQSSPALFQYKLPSSNEREIQGNDEDN